jgi:hypothetical protein
MQGDEKEKNPEMDPGMAGFFATKLTGKGASKTGPPSSSLFPPFIWSWKGLAKSECA